MVTLETKIKAGMAFLDVVRPKWWKKIDVDELDLSDEKICILGEIYGDYFDGKDRLELTDKSCKSLGFYTSKRSQYPALTKLWKTVVRKLQRA